MCKPCLKVLHMCENVLYQFLRQDIPLATFTIYFTCPKKQYGYDTKISACRNRVPNPPTSDKKKRLKITFCQNSQLVVLEQLQAKNPYRLVSGKDSVLEIESCIIEARNRRKCVK